MILRTKLYTLLSFLCFSFYSTAQDVDVPEDYISEFIYGININTNGGLIGGLMFKSTKIIKPKVYRTIGLEVVHVKNPKEIRVTSLITGNSFIYAKRNYLYSFRPQYGRDIILFRKAPEEGIQVSAIFAGGPSLGLVVPYYILYNSPTGVRSVHYDPNIHTNTNDMLGPGNLLDGIGESKIILGLHAKVGMSLDFGTFRNSISGIEVGVTVEGFGQTPELIANPDTSPTALEAPNKNIFTAFYANIFFGTRK